MGFTQSKAEPDIWMHPNGDVYEYIVVYADDLVIAKCIRNGTNPTDVLTKQRGYPSAWTLLYPLMFWQGDMVELILSSDDGSESPKKE